MVTQKKNFSNCAKLKTMNYKILHKKFSFMGFRELVLNSLPDCGRKHNSFLNSVQWFWNINFLLMLVSQNPLLLLKLVSRKTKIWQTIAFESFQKVPLGTSDLSTNLGTKKSLKVCWKVCSRVVFIRRVYLFLLKHDYTWRFHHL